MGRQALFEYKADSAGVNRAPDHQWLLNFRTDGGSILIRMDGIAFDSLMQQIEQQLAQGSPPRRP